MIKNNSEGSAEILVEILLSFLSKPSALLRKLSEQVFASSVGGMTSASLKLLLDVMMTAETVDGVNDLFNREPVDNGLDDGDSVEDDNSFEREEEDIGDENETEDEENKECDAHGEGIEVDEMDIDSLSGEDEELDAALSAVLGFAKADLDEELSSSDEELMDDDAMLALDDNLANIFRQRLKPNHRKEREDSKLQISTFKCKVVDLLEIVVKERNEFCLEMILPLLQALQITKSDAVHSKTLNLLRKVSKSKDLPDAPESLMGFLRKIHEDASNPTRH